MENLLKLSQFSNGELTKLRRRQQRQRQKATVLVSKKNNSARASRFFVHSFAVPARLPREMTKSYYYYYFFFFGGRERQGDKFYHLCLHSGTAPLFSSNRNSLFSSDWMTWDNREVVLNDARSIFQRRFHWRRRCRIVRSLLL